MDIEAFGGQKDDLIILGHFNRISTGDKNDLVRLGYDIDSSSIYIKEACATDEDGSASSYYSSNYTGGAGRKVDNVSKYCAVGNKVNTGSGDDHIQMLFYPNDVRTSIDMGEGFDTFGNADALGLQVSDSKKQYIKNAEIIAMSWFDVASTAEDNTSLQDGIDGWVRQGGAPDCTFLSFINSLCQVDDGIDTIIQKRKLSDYVDIVFDGTNYTVTFKNYIPAEGKVKSITFSKTDFDSFTGSLGDIDTVLVHYAFEKILAKNKDYCRFKQKNISTVHDAQYSVFTKYFMGNDISSAYANHNGTWINSTNGSKLSKEEYAQKFLECWDKYINGEISNIVFAFYGGDNNSIGKINSHAYAVKALETAEDGTKYIVFINPWDDRDCVKFSFDTFFEWNTEFQVYGYEV